MSTTQGKESSDETARKKWWRDPAVLAWAGIIGGMVTAVASAVLSRWP